VRALAASLVVVSIFPFSAVHAGRAARVIDAVAIAGAGAAIRVDGHLTEPSWSEAATTGDFQQREPSEGTPATQATDVRVLFDRDAMYVAVRAFDKEPDRVVGLLTRRDDSSPSDWVSVLVDSYYDRRTAYEFGINPAGVKFDRYWYNDNNSDRGWDAVWDAAVTRTADGWHAEFRIPFSQLRFKTGATGTPDAVGFAVVRTLARANETSTWPLLARSASGYVSRSASCAGFGRRARTAVSS
jgi:hypothetical protein